MGNQVMGTWQNIGYKLGFQDADKALLQRSLTYTFLLGLCAHGFGILNLNICHDSLFDFYDSTLAHQHQIGLGRVLEPLYREMTASGLLMPWSIGLLAFCWLGLAVFLVCKLFHISGRMEIFLIAGIMTVNISVTAIFASYTPWLAADMLALLLASGGGGVFLVCLYGAAYAKDACARSACCLCFDGHIPVLHCSNSSVDHTAFTPESC